MPNQNDRLKLGGGLAIPSPFGTFYAPNISPDQNDGIGKWNEADFVTAVVKGTSPSGAHYYPAFPYTSYQRAKIEDVRDLFAYLKTLAPVQGRVRDHDMACLSRRDSTRVFPSMFPRARRSPRSGFGRRCVRSIGRARR